jgi:hypothetical protein
MFLSHTVEETLGLNLFICVSLLYETPAGILCLHLYLVGFIFCSNINTLQFIYNRVCNETTASEEPITKRGTTRMTTRGQMFMFMLSSDDE